MVSRALTAAEELAKEGIDAEVIDLRSVSPWDKETVLASVRKTGRAVVAHEAVRQCGVGAELSATIAEEAFSSLKAPVTRIGAPFVPIPMSPVLEDLCRTLPKGRWPRPPRRRWNSSSPRWPAPAWKSSGSTTKISCASGAWPCWSQAMRR